MSNKYTKRKNSIDYYIKKHLPTSLINTERPSPKNIGKNDYLLEYVFKYKNSFFENKNDTTKKLFSQRNNKIGLNKVENYSILLTDEYSNCNTKPEINLTNPYLYKNKESTKCSLKKSFNKVISNKKNYNSAITSSLKSSKKVVSGVCKPNEDYKISNNKTDVKNLRNIINQNKPTFNFHFVEMAKKIKLNKEINYHSVTKVLQSDNLTYSNMSKVKEITKNVIKENDLFPKKIKKQFKKPNMSWDILIMNKNDDLSHYTKRQIYKLLKMSDKEPNFTNKIAENRDGIFPSNQFLYNSDNVSSIKSTTNTSNCKNSFSKNVINLDNLENPEELHLASVNFFKYHKKLSTKFDKVNKDNDILVKSKTVKRSNNYTLESVSILDIEIDL